MRFFRLLARGIIMAALVTMVLGASSSFGAAKYQKKESEITATQTALTKPSQHNKDEKKQPTITDGG